MKFHQFKIRFVENKKIFFGISIAVLLIGVIFNVIFGARLDIQFTGGAIVNYSFTGEINTDELAALVEETTGKSVNVNESTDIVAGEDGTINNNVSIEFAGNDALSLEGQKAMEDAIQEKYPDNGFQKLESDSVDPVNGEKFLLKCLCAVGLAAVLMIIYIAFRFRKIGGWSAGVVAVIALLHDVAVIYFTFVVFRMPVDDNFIAVVLTILGYSLNDTIIIYDRIRENRRIMGPKAEIGELVNATHQSDPDPYHQYLCGYCNGRRRCSRGGPGIQFVFCGNLRPPADVRYHLRLLFQHLYYRPSLGGMRRYRAKKIGCKKSINPVKLT